MLRNSLTDKEIDGYCSSMANTESRFAVTRSAKVDVASINSESSTSWSDAMSASLRIF